MTSLSVYSSAVALYAALAFSRAMNCRSHCGEPGSQTFRSLSSCLHAWRAASRRVFASSIIGNFASQECHYDALFLITAHFFYRINRKIQVDTRLWWSRLRVRRSIASVRARKVSAAGGKVLSLMPVSASRCVAARMVVFMLTPLARLVISGIRCLNRSIAFGAMTRFTSVSVARQTRLKPCAG